MSGIASHGSGPCYGSDQPRADPCAASGRTIRRPLELPGWAQERPCACANSCAPSSGSSRYSRGHRQAFLVLPKGASTSYRGMPLFWPYDEEVLAEAWAVGITMRHASANDAVRLSATSGQSVDVAPFTKSTIETYRIVPLRATWRPLVDRAEHRLNVLKTHISSSVMPVGFLQRATGKIQLTLQTPNS